MQQQAKQNSNSSIHPEPAAASMPSFLVVPKGAPLASLAILNAVLGILNTLISPHVIQQSNRAVPYVVQYAPRIMKLLEPCFDRQNNEVQQHLASYLQHMIQVRLTANYISTYSSNMTSSTPQKSCHSNWWRVNFILGCGIS
jgi:predicted PurR-regulated permease PerM